MVYKPKTITTNKSVTDYLATLDESQQRDSQTLIKMMQNISAEQPILWGKIIGFGTYHYKSKRGIEADWFRIGFAPRKGKLSLYITYDVTAFSDDLEKVGTYNVGKGCIYFKNLDHANLDELEKMIAKAYQKTKELL